MDRIVMSVNRLAAARKLEASAVGGEWNYFWSKINMRRISVSVRRR